MKIIEVKNLSKVFKIEIKPQTLFNLVMKMSGRKRQTLEVWALKDINFDVYQNDKIGIIGDNGSGKSTLLRILAGLYRKTCGCVRLGGTTAAFLQLGTGMERDLTVRENIFLFGAILGLERKYVLDKLDDIVQFAGIEEFLCCPLRDLSAGMLQRLSFSITRYVPADILLLDEMLANSDMMFRRKSYRVFAEYSVFSKAVVMISHEIELIRNLCNKVLFLDKGKQIAFGDTNKVLSIYLGRP